MKDDMVVDIINDFLGNSDQTLALLEQSFLSLDAKNRYEKIFRDRLKAVGYKF